jgi:ABC-type nitrate/sulfonate/bicarbonate transport system substrate-binding protein
MKSIRQIVWVKQNRALFWMVISCIALAACRPVAGDGEIKKITMMLDWVPNTNHTGFYVAQANGYFEDTGLQVDIIEPGEVFAEQAVASGVADFGISFQEQVTLARADGAPIVSIAAIIQHNTSGFATRADLGADRPSKWETLTYGAFSSPFEEPTLGVLMACDGGQFDELEIVNVGFADPLALLAEEQIDLAWIFYGWQGIQAEQQGIELNTVMMADWFDCIPDYYTPILIASEDTIASRPDVVSAFVSAVADGYKFAIENPEAAAGILLDAVPELDGELVRASQAWLTSRYATNAENWGIQQLQTWQAYADWMTAYGILTDDFVAEDAFTNEFLP